MTRRIRVALALAAFPALLAGLVACSPAAAPQRDCGSSGCRTPVSCGASKSPQAPTTPVAIRTEPAARLLEQAVPGEELALPAGVFTFSDFRPVPEEQRLGMDVPSRVSGIIGAGTRATAFRMVPRSSTAAGAIPTEFPQSNRLSLMRVTGPSPRLSGFSLLGSEQGHPYNGLLVERTTGARITDLCVAGVPGADHQPPGETFGIADYRTVGSVYRRVQVDGRHVGAAGFGANVSRDLTVIDSRFFDNRYSAGATFWEVDGITLRNVASVGNGLIGLNFERVGGQVHLVHCVTRGNGDGDLRITSDFSSAQYTIEDPVTADGHLTVVLPPTYLGRPNLQRRADVRVLVHGVDRTADVVRFVGG
jgi:hypothetical protein